jgi:hypothetical protein
MHIDPDTKYACWYFSQAPSAGASCGGVDQSAKNPRARADIIDAPAIPACPRDRVRLACRRPIHMGQGGDRCVSARSP